MFCSVCGVDLAEKPACVEPLEPPRYCPACRRRMVVQITPTGWSARCSEHGTTLSG